MLSPFRKRRDKEPKSQVQNATEPGLDPKGQELIARLAAEQEREKKAEIREPSRWRGRRRLSSIEGVQNRMMMSMVPLPLPSDETDPAGRPELSITKQFQKQLEQTQRANLRNRAMSLEGVPKAKAPAQTSARKKSGDRSSLKDRKPPKSSRSSKSLSPRALASAPPASPKTMTLPAPPPPTPRSPTGPQEEPWVGTTSAGEPPQEIKPAQSEEKLDVVRTSTGTSPRHRFTMFKPKKTQTEEPPSSAGRKFGEALGIKFGSGGDSKKKRLQTKLKNYATSMRSLERMKQGHRREGLEKLQDYGIPDQHKLMESLLEHDFYKHSFNGYMRQYYSWVLRSNCLMNMQGRYRGLGDGAECFKVINISQLRTKSEEILRRREHQQAKAEIELNKLRHVARDSLHYRFLKEMADNHAMTLPITIMHSILREVTPVVEGIWRQYVAHLGRLHSTSNQCGLHFVRLRQRLEMYDQLALGDEYGEVEERS